MTEKKVNTNPKSQSNQGYKIDPELLDNKYNQTRKPSLPYGIIINNLPAGILIPFDQLIKSEWLEMPSQDELTTIELTEQITGLLITKTRMLILAIAPEYIRYKPSEDNGKKAGTFVGLYENCRHLLDKKKMDVCSEHALIILNSRNKPLHKIPIVVRFKNVSLWSFKNAKEEFYRTLEKVFYDHCKQQKIKTKYIGKNDKWRSLGVLNIEFKAIREGKGKNKSYCCKTYKISKPTKANLFKLFLAQPQRKQQIWEFHNAIAGFIEADNSSLPALAKSVEQDFQTLQSTSSKKQPRKINQIKEKDYFDL